MIEFQKKKKKKKKKKGNMQFDEKARICELPCAL